MEEDSARRGIPKRRAPAATEVQWQVLGRGAWCAKERQQQGVDSDGRESTLPRRVKAELTKQNTRDVGKPRNNQSRKTSNARTVRA